MILVVSISFTGIYFQNESIVSGGIDAVGEVEKDFDNLVEADTKMLLSTLEILLQDENLMDHYLRGDREEMYEYGQALFGRLKEKYSITHFYFIQPDGKCFVRLHNKDKYDDQVTRFTFKEAERTKDVGVGLELGKTAFALRVVKPYYKNGELIGYLELGQEIDEFLDILKTDSDNDFVIVSEKQYLDESSWESVREVAGLRNDWDDFEDYVIISATSENEKLLECFNSENIERVNDGENVLGFIDVDERKFLCGGFSIVDAGGMESAAMLSVIDVTDKFVYLFNAQFVMVVLFSVFVVVVIVFISVIMRKFIKAIGDLIGATRNLEGGEFDSNVDIKTGDDLEELGNAFNKTMKALKGMDEEKKQLESAKTRFLSITSHELRSPMTPMKAQLEMLMGGYFGNLNKKQKESMDIVLRNTTRLDRIIVDFLEVSRIEAARLKFEFEKTSLVSHIKRLGEEMKGFMPEKNIKLDLKLGNLPVMEVDPNRVGQVLRNLINNAIKFSDPNSKVVINGGLSKGRIVFSVKDSGIGMSQEDQIRVFEPFYQAEQTIYRENQGTGLGLAICRGIVESQDGKIWVESEKGKGSTFYFTVPLVPVMEIKAIKLLFSSQNANEKKIKELLQETLGPMYEKEFDGLKMRSELDKEKLYNYINSLKKQGIVTKEVANEFKHGLDKIFGK
jgi:signal transduction histidine kinase